jgi:hypothetical protein
MSSTTTTTSATAVAEPRPLLRLKIRKPKKAATFGTGIPDNEFAGKKVRCVLVANKVSFIRLHSVVHVIARIVPEFEKVLRVSRSQTIRRERHRLGRRQTQEGVQKARTPPGVGRIRL